MNERGEDSMSVIEVNHVTKDYGNQKGVFDVSFTVEEGEVLGFLGPNGSGKTTTIRQLMGFTKPDEGKVLIKGMDCFKDSQRVQNEVGYLSGEIAFMDEMTGIEFINFIAKMKKMTDFTKIDELMKYLEIDPSCKIRRMSKGMKQKIGLIVAFMQDTPILILDEPTSGLDPLMQNKFVELIQKEKAAGKTILMSSHMFEEVENTCDRVVLIKDGRIVTTQSMEELKHNRFKHYEICFYKEEDACLFEKKYPKSQRKHNIISLMMKGHTNQLIQDLSQFDIEDINVRPQSLEELFLHYYGGEQ